MPPERTHLPRQEPVSCQLCRQRKLKCSRHYPCSNCHARGVSCVYKSAEGVPPPALNAPSPVLSDLVTENIEIRSRLARIERALAGRLESHSCGSSPACAAQAPYDRDGSSGSGEAADSGGARLRLLPLDKRNGASTSARAPEIHIVAIKDLVKCFDDFDELWPRVPFPPLEIGLKLFEQYTVFLHPMQPITHCPTVRKKLENIYANSSQGQEQKVADLALLLTIFSSVAFYCHVEVGPHSYFPSNKDALSAAASWAKIAIDFVWPLRSPSGASLETLQTIIQHYFLVHHMQGLSPEVRMMHSNSVMLARDLGLHKVDTQTEEPVGRQQIIDQEIGRRVWWHLCTTDWQLANLPGQLEGTYIVQPRHMKVNPPRNVTDEDLLFADATFSRPLTEPTPLAYYIQRLRMGEICRTIVDASFDGPCAPALWEQDYQMVMFIDGLYDKALGEMPIFMRLDDEGKPQLDSMDAKYPYLNLLRQIANIMLHARRFKLHLPYIGLAEQDEQYTYSGQVCLRSARRVLQMHDSLKQKPPSDPASGMRINSILRHLIHGVVLMLMGIREDMTQVKKPKSDGRLMRDAEEVLDGMDQQDKSAKTFLNSLKSMLDEHEAKSTPRSLQSVDDFAVSGQNPMLCSTNGQWADPTMGLNLVNLDFDIAWNQFLS